MFSADDINQKWVASFTDAWIETIVPKKSLLFIGSHLLQMRGLKPGMATARYAYYRSHLLQMRGLKPPTVPNINIGNCRIFYRCVD